MAKTLPPTSSKLKGAVQKSDQEKKITELQAQIEHLRLSNAPELTDVIDKLRSQLERTSGEIEISVELIDSNPSQPRQTITNASIQTKARSLLKHGQTSSLILVPLGSGRYSLLDGELRWEAAKVLGWGTIRAVIIPVSEDLNQSSLSTFLGFEDLNPLDRAEAIVREITKSTGLNNNDEIYTTLGNAIKRIECNGKAKKLASLVTLSSSEQLKSVKALSLVDNELKVFQILLQFGLNPHSVKANLMPMLFLPQDLKDAIRNQGLKGAHALACSILTSSVLGVEEEVATKERVKVTSEVLSKNLTVPETRELIKQIKDKYVINSNSESPYVKAAIFSKRVADAIAKINTLTSSTLSGASGEQLEQLKEVLKQKLAEVEELIS
jgi:ParB family transcriptional regulator, chromosome partitioning protein